MSDYYVFRSLEGFPLSDSAREPIKINPVSGTVTYVCIDPLCMHDSSDCPLYGIHTAAVCGNRMFYVSGELSAAQNGERNGHCEVREYNMENGEITKLASYSDDIMLLGAYRNSVYYSTIVYEEEISGFRYALFRSDERKTVKLPLMRDYQSVGGGMDTEDFPSVYAFDGDKILWYAPGETGYAFYATDLNGNLLETFSSSNPYIMNGQYADGFAYYSIHEERPDYANDADAIIRWTNSHEIWRSRLDGSEAVMLCDNAASWHLSGDTVYYTVLEEHPETFIFNEITETNWLGGKIFAMKNDGSEKRRICSVEYDFDLVNTKTFLGTVTDGGVTYLCIAVRDFLTNNFYPSGYEYGLSPSTLIVNAYTGEARLVGLKG
ncbi:MAG: hypothetical protein IK082_00770 [Oscillospiraceae bacterium]|nr:hypothetical protein [Oscillospiraceae bacterium]